MTTERYFDGDFAQIGDEYASILRFAEENPSISYAQLDAQLLEHLSLFAVRENFDFKGLEAATDEILTALPTIKRIFAKPITRLKDTGDILPVEAVRVVNNRTITHASRHSELWDDITVRGLKPRKLLTVNYEDSYTIYENIVFVRVIDLILHLTRKNIRLLRDMLYTGQDLRFNLLDRENHLSYYLALGKLHIGYVKEFDQYRVEAERSLNKLLFIDEVIRARLGSPVYKQCKKQTGKILLKKTNVFRNHKDYHRIYQLSQWFMDANIDSGVQEVAERGGRGDGYGLYCTLLTLFAAGHFGFTFPDESIDLYRAQIECANLDWKLKIETVFCDSVAALRLQMQKESLYSVLLLPATDLAQGKAMLSRLRQQLDADEYLLAIPQEDARDTVYLSLYDLESFRRLQQILLRAMICADGQRSVCPFCGRPLVLEEDQQQYECAACRTVIAKCICPATGKHYFTTQIKNHRLSREREDTPLRDRTLYARRLEGMLHYRNITPLGENAEPICPYCKQNHARQMLDEKV